MTRKGDSASAQNYHVALLLVRTKCRIYLFSKEGRVGGLWESMDRSTVKVGLVWMMDEKESKVR